MNETEAKFAPRLEGECLICNRRVRVKRDGVPRSHGTRVRGSGCDGAAPQWPARALACVLLRPREDD